MGEIGSLIPHGISAFEAVPCVYLLAGLFLSWVLERLLLAFFSGRQPSSFSGRQLSSFSGRLPANVDSQTNHRSDFWKVGFVVNHELGLVDGQSNQITPGGVRGDYTLFPFHFPFLFSLFSFPHLLLFLFIFPSVPVVPTPTLLF